MELRLSNITFPVILTIMLIGVTVFAQQKYTLNSYHGFRINGESNMHDWEMRSGQARGQAVISVANQNVENISNLSVTVSAKSLESDKEVMNKKAYVALKADKYPEIRFEYQQTIESNQMKDGTLHIVCGDLTVAGVTRSVELQVKSKVLGNRIYFSGSKRLNMTDYGIDPPSALLGRLKTRDEIHVNFEIYFELADENSNRQ